MFMLFLFITFLFVFGCKNATIVCNRIAQRKKVLYLHHKNIENNTINN